MNQSIKIVSKSDGKQHDVCKIVFSNNEISVWSNHWYGRHVIGVDCEWLQDDNKVSLPMNINEPFPTTTVLQNLIWATEYLLIDKGYDGHNYEELNICVKKAKELLKNTEQEYLSEKHGEVKMSI